MRTDDRESNGYSRNNDRRDDRDRRGGSSSRSSPEDNRYEERGRDRYQHRDDRGGMSAPPSSNGGSRFGGEPRAVHEVRAQHLTVTIWQREGVSGMEAYSLTLTRRFFSQRSQQYRTTTKLFAEDAPLAAEALAEAYAWIRREIGEPLPF